MSIKPYEPKLSVGDLIEVYGGVMLQGFEEGRLKVARIDLYHGKPAYSFTKPRGKKIVAYHYCSSVDGWLAEGRVNGSQDLNRIEKV